jgi:hypothetical protein
MHQDPSNDRADATLDDLDTDTVEDLDVADDAEDVQGGTSLGCRRDVQR